MRKLLTVILLSLSFILYGQNGLLLESGEMRMSEMDRGKWRNHEPLTIFTYFLVMQDTIFINNNSTLDKLVVVGVVETQSGINFSCIDENSVVVIVRILLIEKELFFVKEYEKIKYSYKLKQQK